MDNFSNELSRIKWTIEEDFLVARLSYERVQGTSQSFDPKQGQVIAAFRIQSHFDIRRTYNPSTGEEQNVVEENTTDRPWNEREFFRVDWAENVASGSYDFDTLSELTRYGALELDPLRYEVSDPNHPDAPQVDPDAGYLDVTLKVFAKPRTIKLPARYGGGQAPACKLPSEFAGGIAPVGNCNPAELTLRQAFRRVDPTSDFEPVDYDGFRFQAAGYFTVDRLGYKRGTGLDDKQWHRLSQRYNLWERSHYYDDPAHLRGEIRCGDGDDPHRDDDGDGTEDACAAVTAKTGLGGSRCDTFSQKCTLPVRSRVVRPIVFHATAGSHTGYEETSATAMQQWDVGMRATVMGLRYAECMAVDKDRARCLAQNPMFFGQQSDIDDASALATEVDRCRYGQAYPGESCDQVADRVGAQRGYDPAVVALAKMTEAVVFCHSPVRAGDAPLCGKVGSVARQGDLRYHHIHTIADAKNGSPWGYGPSSGDPLTGEVVSGRANVWSHATEAFAQLVTDRLRFLKGELTAEDVAPESRYIVEAPDAQLAQAQGGVLPTLTRAELERKYFSQGRAPEAKLDAKLEKQFLQNKELQTRLLQARVEVENVVADSNAPSALAPVYDARRQRAFGSDTEAALMDTPWFQRLGTGPDDPDLSALASPLRLNDPGFSRDTRRAAEGALALRGADLHMAPSPTSLTGLADILESKFGPFDPAASPEAQAEHARRIRDYLAQKLHYSVVVHEAGHTFGLRHNFAGSADAWNYHPQYWQLRTKNGKVTDECTELTDDGERCVGPRFYDPVSKEERDNLLWMWGNSSIMEYPGEATQDFLGLSAYDYMALMMGYGDVVSVYDSDEFKVGTLKAGAVIQKTDTFGGIVGLSYQKEGADQDGKPALVSAHYAQLNKEYGLIRDCREVNPEDYRPAGWDDARDGAWHPTLDGQIVQVDGAYTRCKQIPVDFVPWTSMRTASLDEAQARFESQIRGKNQVDPQGRTRVPYVFGTDNWADLGNLSVYRHDSGADAYELMNFLITEPEVNHIFDAYRRGVTSFSVRNVSARLMERSYEKIRDAAKGLGLYANIYKDLLLAQGYDAEAYWPLVAQQQFPLQVLASGVAFDHFARLLARPQPGPHGLPSLLQPKSYAGVLRSTDDAFGDIAETVVIPNGATGKWSQVAMGGKTVNNQLSSAHGEFDSEYTISAGSYYEKAYTAILMAESQDNFISASRGDFVDGRYRAVSLADLFPDGYRRWLAQNLTGDDRLKGAWLYASNKKPQVDGGKLPARPLGWTSWWTQSPEVCFPAASSTVCSSLGDTQGLGGDTSASAVPVDPQVGWEQQKQLIAYTLIYLPENQQQWWLDQMAIYDVGKGNDPGFKERVEFHDPLGRTYVARSIGRETLFGQEVEKGIGARVLEYANQLLREAYEVQEVDANNDGKVDYIEALRDDSGAPIVRSFAGVSGPSPTHCGANPSCVRLSRYVSVPTFLRQALVDFGYANRLVGLL